MSRCGYVEYLDNWTLIRWRGQVASATRGKRGQAMLKELLEALDAMPEKRLIAHDLERDGEFCTLGVLGAKRGIPLHKLDTWDYDGIAGEFNIAPPLVQEIEYMNDEWCENMTPEQRWEKMRDWVEQQIKP